MSAWSLLKRSQISLGVMPISRALVSVAVPYSSVPHTYSVFQFLSLQYLLLHKGPVREISMQALETWAKPQKHNWSKGGTCCYLAKTSALNTEPTMFPRWGTLLTYGRALVIKTFLSPFFGRLEQKTSIIFAFYNSLPIIKKQQFIILREIFIHTQTYDIT